jgi:hypothetical protein
MHLCITESIPQCMDGWHRYSIYPSPLTGDRGSQLDLGGVMTVNPSQLAMPPVVKTPSNGEITQPLPAQSTSASTLDAHVPAGAAGAANAIGKSPPSVSGQPDPARAPVSGGNLVSQHPAAVTPIDTKVATPVSLPPLRSDLSPWQREWQELARSLNWYCIIGPVHGPPRKVQVSLADIHLFGNGLCLVWKDKFRSENFTDGTIRLEDEIIGLLASPVNFPQKEHYIIRCSRLREDRTQHYHAESETGIQVKEWEMVPRSYYGKFVYAVDSIVANVHGQRILDKFAPEPRNFTAVAAESKAVLDAANGTLPPEALPLYCNNLSVEVTLRRIDGEEIADISCPQKVKATQLLLRYLDNEGLCVYTGKHLMDVLYEIPASNLADIPAFCFGAMSVGSLAVDVTIRSTGGTIIFYVSSFLRVYEVTPTAVIYGTDPYITDGILRITLAKEVQTPIAAPPEGGPPPSKRSKTNHHHASHTSPKTAAASSAQAAEDGEVRVVAASVALSHEYLNRIYGLNASVSELVQKLRMR